MKTIPLGPFFGINNRLPDFELNIRTRQMQGNWLRSAVNVDIDNAGKVRRRKATRLVQAMTGAHSLHMTSATTGYVVRASAMHSITLPTYSETLFKVLSSDAPVRWSAIGDDLYYSSATDNGRITAGVWYPMGLPTPAAPTYSFVGGTLLAATYQISVSYFNNVTGEEGGISPSCNPALTTTGGIRIPLPAATPGATHINIYLSLPSGSVTLWLAQVATGTAIYDCIALPTGREAAQRFEAPLPLGELFTSNGRLCVISGSNVCVGLPYRPGYYLPEEGYIPFAAPVTVAIENQGGTYIAADETFWVPGDLGDNKDAITAVLPYGAVRGTAFALPITPNDSAKVGWFTPHGLAIGNISGGVDMRTEKNVDVVAPASGTSVVFETDGYRRVVTCGYCVNLESGALTSYSDWAFTSTSGGYGTQADGIYALSTEGEVDASVGLGKQDFGVEELKHLPSVYLGVNSDMPMRLRVQTPSADYTYDARGSGTDLKMQRVDPGKALRSTWYDLTLSNQGGADFILASVSFAPTVSKRRI